MAFSPDGRILLTGEHDGIVTLWDIVDRKPSRRSTLTGHAASVTAVAFRPDGLMASIDWLGTMILWDPDSNPPTRLDSWVAQFGMGSIAFSPDGRRLVTAGDGAPATMWTVADYGAPTPLVRQPPLRG
jgi:WD40 repeat protein